MNRQNCRKTCSVFAVKILKKQDKLAFAHEVSVLGKLSESRHTHNHLINLLAAYEKKGDYHLVFPWAECDLLEYWNRFPCPDQSSQRAIWLQEQTQGIAEALNMMHRYKTFSGGLLRYGFDDKGQRIEIPQTVVLPPTAQSEQELFGRHGDLKPTNILWFPVSHSRACYGILKIADFGSAEFTTSRTKHGKVPYSRTYQSPEYGLSTEHSIACDIWALGCIYLECTTWFFGGSTAIQEFNDKRLEIDYDMAQVQSDKFYSIEYKGFRRTASVKGAVTEVSSTNQLLTTN
jgi:serine/threonine protein kinase